MVPDGRRGNEGGVLPHGRGSVLGRDASLRARLCWGMSGRSEGRRVGGDGFAAAFRIAVYLGLAWMVVWILAQAWPFLMVIGIAWVVLQIWRD